MGISGLLQFLKGAIQDKHLKDFSTKRVAVDALSWLHIGLMTQHPEVQQSEFSLYSYLVYPIRMIKLLLHYDIKPVFVFDGKHLSNKDETAERRQRSREQNQNIAEKLAEKGLYEQAEKYLVRSQAVTRGMINAFIDLLHVLELEVQVAPGEADPQLAFLLQSNYVDCVISEDSDVIAFGSTKVIFKLKTNGTCHFFDKGKLDTGISADYTLMGRFSRFKLSLMCVLAGCDYVDSLKGVGPKKALDLVWKCDSLGKLWRTIVYIPKLKPQLTDDYKGKVAEALRHFLYYPVYNPLDNSLCPLTHEETELQPIVPTPFPVSDLRLYVSGRVDVFSFQPRTEFADKKLLLSMHKRFKIPKHSYSSVSFEFETPKLKRSRENMTPEPIPIESPPPKKPKTLETRKKWTWENEVECLKEMFAQIYEGEDEVDQSVPEEESKEEYVPNPFRTQPKSSLFSPKFEILSQDPAKCPSISPPKKGQQTLFDGFLAPRKVLAKKD